MKEVVEEDNNNINDDNDNYNIDEYNNNSNSIMNHDNDDDNDNNNNNNNEELKVLGICGGIGSGKSSASKLLVSDLGCIKHLDADKIAHSVYEPGSQAIQDIIDGFHGYDILLLKEEQEEEEENDDDDDDSPAVVTTPKPTIIDRKKLGSIVFGDRNEMAKLERIVWPHVKTKLINEINIIREEWKKKQQKQQLDKNKSKGDDDTSTNTNTTTTTTTNTRNYIYPIVVVEAAVLLDAGWEDILDGIWIITSTKSISINRLIDTRDLSEDEAIKRYDAQLSRRGIGIDNIQREIQSGYVQTVIENNGTIDDLKLLLKNAITNPNSWRKSEKK